MTALTTATAATDKMESIPAVTGVRFGKPGHKHPTNTLIPSELGVTT